MLDEPGTVADNAERNRLISPLRALSNADVMQARPVQGILYIESCTNLDILRAWAALPGHRAEALLATEVMWKPAILQARDGGADNAGVRARDHFEAMQLERGELPGIELLDEDAHPSIQEGTIAGTGLQRLRWRHHEIEG